jgi:phosphoglucomutase
MCHALTRATARSARLLPGKYLLPKVSMEVTTVVTKPIAGQKPGTSGLRQKTRTFMGESYLQNFVQSVFDALVSEGVAVKGGTLCEIGRAHV